MKRAILCILLIAILPTNALALRVMASTLPLYVFAKNIGTGLADVGLLVPPGTDIHEFSLKPSDIRNLKDSDLVLLNGAGLDDHIRDRAGSKAIDTSKGIRVLSAGRQIDPHIWLDPSIAIIQVKNIRDAFISKDPINSKKYIQNSEEYIKRLNALDTEIANSLKPLKGKYLITYHEAFNYFAKRYGLLPFSLTGLHAETPLAGRMKEAYEIIKNTGIKAIFVEKQFPEDSARRLAKSLGVRVCRLDSLESGQMSPSFYEDAMRENASNIVKCLEGSR